MLCDPPPTNVHASLHHNHDSSDRIVEKQKGFQEKSKKLSPLSLVKVRHGWSYTGFKLHNTVGNYKYYSILSFKTKSKLNRAQVSGKKINHYRFFAGSPVWNPLNRNTLRLQWLGLRNSRSPVWNESSLCVKNAGNKQALNYLILEKCMRIR